MPAVIHRSIRAASATADMNSGLNPVSEEINYAENDNGIPLLLRGRTVESLDEAGVRTSYAYAFGTFDSSTRIFTAGGPTNHVKIIRSASGALTQIHQFLTGRPVPTMIRAGFASRPIRTVPRPVTPSPVAGSSGRGTGKAG
jgi:hypothetical protein